MAAVTSLENNFLRIDVGVEPTLRVSVTDKRNGFVWECLGAPFALHYWQTAQFAIRYCPVTTDHGWEYRLMPREDSLEVQCTWPRAACGFRGCFRLDGPKLGVWLPTRRFVENQPFDVRQMAIDVLPGLGGAPAGERGFLLVPQERGKLCRFDKTEEHETSLLLYADNDRALTAPVFGIARETAGLLGVITGGEFNAELVIAARRAAERVHHEIGPRARIRIQSADAMETEDFRVSYHFLTGGDVSYAGMARTYRTYLTETAGQRRLRERMAVRPMLDYEAGGPTIHVQLAEKRRKTRMTGDGELVVKTRFTEVRGIAQSIRDAGIERATIVLVGWNTEGRDGLYPGRFPVESAVGGPDAMSQALSSIAALGFQPGVLDNYTDMYRRSPAFREEFAAKQLGGHAWRGGIWAGGQSYVVCPQEAMERHVQRDVRRLRDLGLEGLLFLDHCPGPGVLRCYDPEHPLTRSQYAEQVREIIRTAQATFGLCQVSGPSVFTALEADSCMMPVHEVRPINSLDRNWFADETVPFLPMALHGIVLLAGDADADPLRVIEYGAVPVYSTTAPEHSRTITRMMGCCRRYATDIAPLAEEFIESHDTPGDGLVKVGYSGGAEVLINRTDKPAEIGGVTVEPRDFQLKR